MGTCEYCNAFLKHKIFNTVVFFVCKRRSPLSLFLFFTVILVYIASTYKGIIFRSGKPIQKYLQKDNKVLIHAKPDAFTEMHKVKPHEPPVHVILNASTLYDVMGPESCISGHVEGFKPVCGGDGCLRILKPPEMGVNKNGKRNKERLLPGIRPLTGLIMSTDVQMWLLSNLTEMQWTSGIYGSVGEFGVLQGKYTSMLALNTDVNAGERLFVADIFAKTVSGSSGYGSFENFLKNMQRVGFSPTARDPKYGLYVWYDSTLFISKAIFLHWNLPAFRIISIDAWHSRPMVLNDFKKAACIVREGAILVFDDARFRREEEVDEGIQDFFFLFGDSAFKPLLYVANKLFVCTSKYHNIYVKYIRRHIKTVFKLREVKGNIYQTKSDHIYFTISKN